MEDLQQLKNNNSQKCFEVMKIAADKTATTKGAKGECLKEFVSKLFSNQRTILIIFMSECKKAEDDAISIINACGDTRTAIIGSFRSMMSDMEDEEFFDNDENTDDFRWIKGIM